MIAVLLDVSVALKSALLVLLGHVNCQQSVLLNKGQQNRCFLTQRIFQFCESKCWEVTFAYWECGFPGIEYVL